MNCKSCGYTWRPIKKHHHVDTRWVQAYLLDGSSVRRLGERWKVNSSTAWRRIQRSLHPDMTVDVLVVMKPFCASNIILIDAKHFKVRRQTYTLYVCLNAHTSKPICWILMKGSEGRIGYDQILGTLKQRNVNIEAVVSDNDQSIRCSINDWYPNAIQQKCAFHLLKTAFTKINGRRIIKTMYGQRLWNIIKKIVLGYDTYNDARKYFLRIKRQEIDHAHVWKLIDRNLKTVYQFEQKSTLPIPRTSNQIENFMGVIEQRIKTFRSFKNAESLIKIVSAFIKIKYKRSTN